MTTIDMNTDPSPRKRRNLRTLPTLVAVLATAAVAAQEPVLVLQGGTRIDGRGGAPVAEAVVVVPGDRIAAVVCTHSGILG